MHVHDLALGAEFFVVLGKTERVDHVRHVEQGVGVVPVHLAREVFAEVEEVVVLLGAECVVVEAEESADGVFEGVQLDQELVVFEGASVAALLAEVIDEFEDGDEEGVGVHVLIEREAELVTDVVEDLFELVSEAVFVEEHHLLEKSIGLLEISLESEKLAEVEQGVHVVGVSLREIENQLGVVGIFDDLILSLTVKCK